MAKHLENVATISQEIVESKYLNDKEILSDTAYLNGVAHDFGKSTTYFQSWLNEKNRSQKAYHSFLSAFLGYYLIAKYLDGNTLSDRYSHLPAISWIVINKHHGNLSNIRGGYEDVMSKLRDQEEIQILQEQIDDIKTHNLEEVQGIYSELLKNFDFDLDFNNFFETLNDLPAKVGMDLKQLTRDKKIEHYVDIMFLYSVLLDSDKLDASGLERIPERWGNCLKRETVDRYKEIKFDHVATSELNKLRESAYQDVNLTAANLDLEDRTLSINLPTGTGKTLAGFSAAINLRKRIEEEKGFTPKIIYSLPFLSIIDQNSSVLMEILAELAGLSWTGLLKMDEQQRERKIKEKIPSNLLLKHHHLADVKYTEKKDGELYSFKDLNLSMLLTEGWHSEIVITTFVQFFHSLITNRNRAAKKFHNITNSIIVLDEVQSIPHKFWLLIRKILKHLSEKFNCWIILMTATQPLIFKQSETIEFAKDRVKYFKSLDRIEYRFALEKKEISKLEIELLEKIRHKNRDLMIVLNTINSARGLYTSLKENLAQDYKEEPIIDSVGICRFPDFELIYLSTHILPEFRKRRIERIKNDQMRKVIVTTQLIEAGVDISVDVIYRDFAPLDSIIQTAGRCNRGDSQNKGVVKVIQLWDADNGSFYHSYIYDSTLIDITKETISEVGEKIGEKEFNLKAVEAYYTKSAQRKAQDREIVENLTKLNFSDISKFSLISKDLPAVTIFVEIDENARRIRQQLEDVIRNERGFAKRAKLLELRKEINTYTLSINCSENLASKITSLPQVMEREDFRYIPEDDLSNWYTLDIGFQLPKSTITSRIL